ERENIPSRDDLFVAKRTLSEYNKKIENLQRNKEEIRNKVSSVENKINMLDNQLHQKIKDTSIEKNPGSLEEVRNVREETSEILVDLKSKNEQKFSLEAVKVNSESEVERIEYDLEELYDEIKYLEKNIDSTKSTLNTLEEFLKNKNIDSIKKQIEDINFREKSIPSKLESCNLQIGKMINKKENSITSINNLKITINENRLASELAQKNYQDECELGYVAINELENYKYQSTSSKKLEVILSELISKNSNILSEYKIKSKFIFPNSGDNERVDYTFTANRIEKPLFYLTDYLKQEIEDLELLITKGDREIFEGILLEDLSRKILAIIHNSKIWIKEINNLMDNMESSSSLKLDLKWEPKKAESEGELGTQQLINYLNTKDTLTESEKERFRNHFISKIKKAINLSAS
ncbi:MAG: hypothetical protein ACRC0F_08645, partial [Cetobacterium sp.]